MKHNFSTIGFIGGGRITRIFLEAFKNKSVLFERICVYEPDLSVAEKLNLDFPDLELAGSEDEAATQSLVFLAVHPPVLKDVFSRIKDAIRETSLIISLAPKITIVKMETALSTGSIVRMIPNATSFINEGYNPVSFGSGVSSEQRDMLMSVFEALGDCFEVSEDKLEAYAIISAMLPTYFWFQWDKIKDIAIKTGLDEDESEEIIYQSLIRSINIFYNSGLSPTEVIDLIPVKPIGDHEKDIENILESKLLGLYEKIKT